VIVKILCFASSLSGKHKMLTTATFSLCCLIFINRLILTNIFLHSHIIPSYSMLQWSTVTFWLSEYMIIHILDIIHHAVFISNKVLETGLCLWPQVKSYSVRVQWRELTPFSSDSHAVIIQVACMDLINAYKIKTAYRIKHTKLL
jgi:hypothetical protein